MIRKRDWNPSVYDEKKIPYGTQWDKEEPDWYEYLETMVDAIKNGYCDNILKQLAKAIFDRRDVLMGREPGTSFTGKPITDTEGNTHQVINKEDAPLGKLRLRPVIASTTEPTFTVKGKTYLKKDLIGKTIQIPASINVKYVQGLKVRVLGVGEQRVKIAWLDLPREGSSYRKAHDAGNPTFLPLVALEDVLA